MSPSKKAAKAVEKKDNVPQVVPTLPARRDPSDVEKAQIAIATARRKQRPLPPSVKYLSAEGGNIKVMSPHADEHGWCDQLDEAFGTRSTPMAQIGLSQLGSLLGSRFAEVGENEVNAMLAAVSGIAPRDEIEGMLAVQMVGTHYVAFEMLRRARRADDRHAVTEYGNLATKLLRTYTTQLEALAKSRRGGEQKVRVEHVHVYPGGQAIVGNVETGGGGAFDERGQQSHDLNGIAALAYAPGAPVWSEEPGGKAMPRCSGEGQEALPNARRDKPRRPKRAA